MIIYAIKNKKISKWFLNFRSMWWKRVEQARPAEWRPCLVGRPGSQAQASPDSLVSPQNNIMQKFGGEFSSRTHISNAHEVVFICIRLMWISQHTHERYIILQSIWFQLNFTWFSPADNISNFAIRYVLNTVLELELIFLI